MAKAKTSGRKTAKAPAAARRRASRPQQAAMPRSMQNRGSGDTRKAVQTPRAGRSGSARTGPPQDALTRVTHETEVRGTETRIERVVERAPKPSVPDVDRSSGRGRYVYCIIRSTQPLKFGALGMDEQWADVYTINYKDMAAIVSDVP